MSGETGIFDVYGFELTVSAAEKADRYACAEYALRREAKWEPFVKSQCLPEGAKLKRYVRKGVPPVLRGWVWWHTSGAAAHRERGGATHFQRMVEAGERRPCLRQIELDLPRTFPRNTWVPTPEGLAALRSVLVAYSAHNPDVGYCQGMNFLAALLLVAVEKDAERCFWLLVALLEGILYPKTYAPQLDGCHVEMRVLAELLKAKAPKLHRHMEAMGCEVSLFATDWFLVLFATTLPAETAARVWDSVFLEGTKVLFRVALALLIMHQGLLLKKDNPGELLKALKDANLHVHQRDRLMAAAFKDVGSFPMAKIRDERAAKQREVDAMLAARAASKRKGDLRNMISQARNLQDERTDAEIAGNPIPVAGGAAGGAGVGAGAGAAPPAQDAGGAGGGGGGGAPSLLSVAPGGVGRAAQDLLAKAPGVGRAAQEQARAAASAAGQAASAAGQAASTAATAASAATLNRIYASFKSNT